MEQVLGNVLVNAAQAMPQGGSLTVGTTRREEGFAEISVQDTGPGIPEAIRGRIFDPFFTTKPQGTGLGLSIVYRIMEAHGGKVEVHSVMRDDPRGGAAGGAGTRIVLSLPLGAAHGSDDVAPAERG
jgi:signal transduction histidine kinase